MPVIERDDYGNSLASLEKELRGWDPPQDSVEDQMDLAPVRALAAALNQPMPNADMVPPLWHWLYFHEWERTDALGPDGHPLGGLMPPIPRRTRMFAGVRVTFSEPLRLGEVALLRSGLSSRRATIGRSGPMLLVTERHEIVQGGKLVLVEERDLIYRSRPTQSRSQTPPRAAVLPSPMDMWKEAFVADPVLLFRFSAFTANSHRIHYDEPYATHVEHYQGLVVHGPLLAIAMAGMLGRHLPGIGIGNLRIRFRRPVFAGEQTFLMAGFSGRRASISTVGADGVTRADAEVALI